MCSPGALVLADMKIAFGMGGPRHTWTPHAVQLLPNTLVGNNKNMNMATDEARGVEREQEAGEARRGGERQLF